MTILLSDPRVHAVPVRDTGEPLIQLPEAMAPTGVVVRRSLATRLIKAHAHLPAGLGLLVVEGHRSPADQQRILDTYERQVRAAHPDADEAEVARLTSRFVSPMAVAPHVAGAAVDVTLVDVFGDQLDLGTHIDATPEQSDGKCWFAAAGIGADARAHRQLLAKVLTNQGLVNYPTEWWHWSFGDRYSALATGAQHALYGPVDRQARAA